MYLTFIWVIVFPFVVAWAFNTRNNATEYMQNFWAFYKP